LRIHHRVNIQIGGDRHACELSFDEIFGQCNPRSDDMKKFKERVFGKFSNEISQISHEPLFRSEIAGWLMLFKRSAPETVDPTFSRLHDWCKISGKNCSEITLTKIKEAVAGFCEKDRHLIQTICNEKDDLYGMSYIEKSSELVKSSSAFNLINGAGMGENCLRRYVKIFSSRENYNRDLAQLYPTIYAYLLREKSRYPQGELFLPGALKEFDMKGLSDFLTALRPPEVKKAVVVQKPRSMPPKLVAVVKTETKPPEVKPEPPVALPAVPEIHISEFERAVAELREKKLDRLSLDMDAFQSDFEFTTKMISELSLPLRKFQTRKALKEMKTFDHLGTKEAPLGVMFIKFLIDTENHQGLYNVVGELTNKFYVHNDLENKKVPVYVELKNDSSTQNKWQLTILRPQNDSEAPKVKK
jgi:hypothetical protein